MDNTSVTKPRSGMDTQRRVWMTRFFKAAETTSKQKHHIGIVILCFLIILYQQISILIPNEPTLTGEPGVTSFGNYCVDTLYQSVYKWRKSITYHTVSTSDAIRLGRAWIDLLVEGVCNLDAFFA